MKLPGHLLLFLFMAGLSLNAQSYVAKKIIFKNPGPFTQLQLEAVTGLHGGQVFTVAQLNAAALRLSDTGYFDSVGAAGDNQNIVFDLKPSDPASFLPVGFDNFVWLSHAEIDAALHKALALFNATLPEAGPQADAVAAALTAALVDKDVQAKVEHQTVEPTLEHPQRTMEFRVSKPAPVVANVKLGGVTPELVPLVQKSVNSATRTFYNEGPTGVVTADLILAPLRNAGYVEAALTAVSLDPGQQSASTVPVVVSATLNAGQIFHVGQITFAGSPLLTAEAFAATATLHTGDVASHSALLKTLAPLDAAYRHEGYMDVIVTAQPSLVHETNVVNYTVTVTPGSQYHIGQISQVGLDPAARAEFDANFHLKPGGLFDPAYVSSFLTKNSALRLVNRYAGGYTAYAYPDTHLVDVVVTFVLSQK